MSLYRYIKIYKKKQNKIVLLECNTNGKYNPKVNVCSNREKYNRNKMC